MTTAQSLALLVLASTAALAQGSVSANRKVTGVVFDSVGRAPLAGAVVEVMMVDPEKKEKSPLQSNLPSFATLTDAAGHFELSGLAAGLYAVGFQHHVLNALGIESPITPLDLRVDSIARLNLAIPGGKALRDRACPGKTNDGLLAGYVVNARGGAPLDSVSVSVGWEELNFGRGNLSTSLHEAKASPDSTGRFSLCG